MTISERKKAMVGAIRKLEDRLVMLRYCEYDGGKSQAERDEETDVLQKHLRCAHNVLVLLTEEEMGVAS